MEKNNLALGDDERRFLQRLRDADTNGFVYSELSASEQDMLDRLDKRKLVRCGPLEPNGTGRWAYRISSRGRRAMNTTLAAAEGKEK